MTDTTPLSIEEATEQLRELDQLLYRRKITGIAYRNKKERLLARISKPAPSHGDAPTHRYTTRRQVNALNPSQRTSYVTTTPTTKNNQRYQRPISKGPSNQQMRREMSDFIVYGEDEDDIDASSSVDSSEQSAYNSADEKEMRRAPPTQAVVQQQAPARQNNAIEPPVTIYTDIDEQKARERREQEEHFKSVTVQFRRTPQADDNNALMQHPPTAITPSYSPMFPPKQAKTLYIDFGTNKF